MNGQRKCWLFHSWGVWQRIVNPDQYTTSAMYKAGVKPAQIRTCEHCGEQELRLVKWEGQ